MKPILSMIDKARAMKGSEAFEFLISKASDEKLKNMLSIMDPKARATSEQKLMQLAYELFEHLTVLDDAAAHVGYVKGLIFSEVFRMYGEEYCVEKQGEGSYDNAAFYSYVAGVVKYRKGLRAGVDFVDESAGTAGSDAADGSGCIIA